jgi:hypothetical protein
LGIERIRNVQVWSKVMKWQQHKESLPGARMRDSESVLVYNGVVVYKDIQVDCSGQPHASILRPSSKAPLNQNTVLEQHPRLERREEETNGIEVRCAGVSRTQDVRF